jgi:mannose-6-phosphate isomerase
MMLAPIRLMPSYREKVWGTTDLEPWFPRTSDKIGEVWFTFDDNRFENGRRLVDVMRELGPRFHGTNWTSEEFPILTKFIFTSDRLSVQVHPDDERAREWENWRGKTEMWHVLRAGPGAAIALGLCRPVTRDRLREIAVSGEIEQLMRWFPVQPGDTFFTPTGTIHAIGAGIALCEIQQNSDLTYRLYDYGRPRELHLDKAVAVADLSPHPGQSTPREIRPGRRLLACCRHFATELWEVAGAVEYRPDARHLDILMIIDGAGALAGRDCAAGDVWIVPAAASPFPVQGRVRFLRTYVPGADMYTGKLGI